MKYKIPEGDKEWAEFGKKIYDSAMSVLADLPCKSVRIPFPNEDNAICTVIIEDPPVFVHIKGWGEDQEFVHKYLMSDGSYKEVKK